MGISLFGLVGGSAIVTPPVAFGVLPDATSFSFIGAAQRYAVPDDVCAVRVVAAGAQGGSGSLASEVLGDELPGGLGGVSTSDITVSPGEVLQVNVGGQGGSGTWTGSADEGGPGGWNGGAVGGSGGDAGGGGGGGGGGASDVRRGGTGLDARVVVAGGGGGSGAYSAIDTAPHSTGGAAETRRAAVATARRSKARATSSRQAGPVRRPRPPGPAVRAAASRVAPPIRAAMARWVRAAREGAPPLCGPAVVEAEAACSVGAAAAQRRSHRGQVAAEVAASATPRHRERSRAMAA